VGESCDIDLAIIDDTNSKVAMKQRTAMANVS